MALNCEACSDLREYAPDFVLNGVTDDIAASLENNTGLNPSLDPIHKDCEDLNDVNDCLVGNMEAEVDAYEVCDWKAYVKKIIPNIHQTIKAVIASICGIWKNIEKLFCLINFILEGVTIEVGENPDTSANCYVVAGKGVSFLKPHAGQAKAADISLVSFGTLFRVNGTCEFYTSDFTDEAACGNYDGNTSSAGGYAVSKNRKGNSVWGDNFTNIEFGELAFEIRMNRRVAPYDIIKNFSGGFGQGVGSGAFQCLVMTFGGGSYAYGQHGDCSTSTGEPVLSDYSKGHLVPDGWTYVQVRIKNTWEVMGDSDGKRRTPRGILFFRSQRDEIPCE